MNIRRTRLISPPGISLRSHASPATATSRIAVRSATHAVRDFSRNSAPDEAGFGATIDTSVRTLNSAKSAASIQQLADAKSEVRSLIVTGRIGPSLGGRTASRILLNGAVSAKACIRQIGRSAARTDHDSQTTFNRPPAADALSRRWAI
jgi:hypothetical protein